MSSRNEADPQPRSHLPAILGMALVASVLLAVPLIFIRHVDRPRPGAAPLLPQNDEMLAGERVYQRNCVGCHESRGEGRAGQYPSLVGASWLLEDKETPIRLMLLGAAGPMEVDGRRYDNVMPNFGVNLTDEEIANVLTFVRARWGNKAGMITPAEVAQVRASLAGRTGPWTSAALLEARKTSVLR